ncbi:MAG: hypothetical protein M3O82_09775 [Verrucomicrobiota bacterium]|nr:hypothetical protein [Verrucomicrobiota bacterium]
MPEIVPVVLNQLAQMRSTHSVTDAFEEKVRRLFADELEPHDLFLLVRKLADGRVRFIIKDRVTDSVIDMLDCA